MDRKTFTFRAMIEPDEPEGYHGYVPALPGCHTCGDTVEETKENLKDAILGIIETMLEHNVPIPEDHFIEVLQTVELEPSYAQVASITG